MTRKIVALVALVALFNTAFSQETSTKKVGRPDIPGAFVLELGLNNAPGSPNDFSTGFWGSRTLNVYYQYDMRILNSKFSFVPGIGFSFERFKFKNDYTLGYNNNGALIMQTPAQAGLAIKKSQLITNYLDVPLEICFRTNPDDPARSFRASVGGRVGYLFDSFAKLKYSENGETKKMKSKQDFDLSKLRYGVYAKVGAGNFSLFGYYNLSNLFEDGKGPLENSLPKDFNTFTVGISLASF